MPGIVGIITKRPQAEAQEQLCRMLRTMRHESFYASGTWSDPSQGIYIGWVARSGQCSAEMPLSNERNDVTLLFSGEEFPEPGTRNSLRAKGHAISTDGPAYLVHRYEEERDFPAQLNGRFHGLVVDADRGTSLLFNDRYGLHRLYFHEGKNAFYFAA